MNKVEKRIKEIFDNVEDIKIIRDLKESDCIVIQYDSTLNNAELRLLLSAIEEHLSCKVLLVPIGLEVYNVGDLEDLKRNKGV
jgi:hypothetical protein